LRVIAAGERVLHEPAIVHALRFYDDKIDRNAVMPFYIDSCKAFEKVGWFEADWQWCLLCDQEAGEEMSLTLRLVVALVVEKKHTEFLAQQQAGRVIPSEPSYFGRWPSRLASRLGVEESEIQVFWWVFLLFFLSLYAKQSLLTVVDRSLVLFDSPHVGPRGAALFASCGKIEMTDDAAAANVSLVASPDAATVTTLRPLKPGEKLVALRRRTRCRAGTAAEVLSNLKVDASCNSEWLNELVAAITETVFSTGTPVVDDVSKWPALDVLVDQQAVWQSTFANDGYALSFLSFCMIMGAKNSKPLEASSPDDLVKLAVLVGKYPRELMLREKSFAKPWLSTFYSTMLKFYRSSIPSSFLGLVVREINA
jgi:hypothetical protein